MKLQEGETILYEGRPEPAVLGIWFFSKALLGTLFMSFFVPWLGLMLSAFYIIASGTNENPSAPGGFGTVLILVPVLFLASLVYIVLLRKTYSYVLTNRRCIFEGGILRRVRRSVPYHKITDVEVSQNILERVLQISRLHIVTPGTVSPFPTPFQFGTQHVGIMFVGLKDSETPAELVGDILKGYRATGE